MPSIAEINSAMPPFEAGADGTMAALQDVQGMLLTERMLAMWTVYNSPADFPGRCVARLHVSGRAGLYVTGLAVVGNSLEDVRGALPAGLHRIDRWPGDQAQIVEVWL